MATAHPRDAAANSAVRQARFRRLPVSALRHEELLSRPYLSSASVEAPSARRRRSIKHWQLPHRPVRSSNSLFAPPTGVPLRLPTPRNAPNRRFPDSRFAKNRQRNGLSPTLAYPKQVDSVPAGRLRLVRRRSADSPSRVDGEQVFCLAVPSIYCSEDRLPALREAKC